MIGLIIKMDLHDIYSHKIIIISFATLDKKSTFSITSIGIWGSL